ncbi:MAG: hypothetical protein WCO06_02760 [Candidatus Roizmanbacteria bacterium]
MKKFKHLLLKFLPVLFCIPFAIIINIFYYKLQTSYNFVDEHYNILAGYAIKNGSKLYSDFAFNRQPGMAWISYLIQEITHPNSLYLYIIRHRLFMIVYSVVTLIFLSFRFGWYGLGIAVLYESVKFYNFGFTFQAESFSGYLLLYIFGLIFSQWMNKKIYTIEYYIVTILTWFLIFTREPYIPLYLFIYAIFLSRVTYNHDTPQLLKKLQIKVDRTLVVNVGLLILLNVITLSCLPLKQYYEQVVGISSHSVAGSEISDQGGILGSLLRSILYPIYILVGSRFSNFHVILIILTFYIGYTWNLIFKTIDSKQKYTFLFHSLVLFCILFLSALRTQDPGTDQYGSYRMNIWVSAYMSIAVFLFIKQISIINIIKSKLPSIIAILLALYIVISPRSYLWKEKQHTIQDSFFISFNQDEQPGHLLRSIKQPTDTLFVDGYASLIFLSSGIPSAFPYYVYYPVMQFGQYEKLKNAMFINKPPTFVYFDCQVPRQYIDFPHSSYSAGYIELLKNYNNSCLFIRKDRAEKLSSKEKESLIFYEYTFPQPVKEKQQE